MFARKTTQILAASLALIAMGCDSEPAGLDDPPLSSFLLTSTESVLIEPGDAVTVTATKNGQAATGVTWTTANANVATVNNGTISAVAAGAAVARPLVSGQYAALDAIYWWVVAAGLTTPVRNLLITIFRIDHDFAAVKRTDIARSVAHMLKPASGQEIKLAIQPQAISL